MYSMRDLITKKKRGQSFSKEEIQYLITHYTAGHIPDYQMAALLMAICFQGMSDLETAWLTDAMANSGDRLDLSAIHGIKVDKHSTGGIGDKTTLVVGPMVASLGIPVAKMSGRGLGYTGGTIDKLESIPGFSTSLTEEDFFRNVNELKLAIAGQTANLAPADKQIYALRDVTATVDEMSLIASSIMSKKLASGADAIVLDVKAGEGAFMKTPQEALQLAQLMIAIGTHCQRKMAAVISDMNEPLGFAVGNALEVKEAIETLLGNGPSDLVELSYTLAGLMAVKGKKAGSLEEAKMLLQNSIQTGKAFDTFCRFVEAQGGTLEAILEPDRLCTAPIQEPVYLESAGYVTGIHAEEIGRISLLLGGGRQTKESVLDHAVGVVLRKKTGAYISTGEPIALIHARTRESFEMAADLLRKAVTLSDTPPKKNRTLIYEMLS